MKISATIFMNPIGKARPRHVMFRDKAGQPRVRDYIPAPTLTAQGLIQAAIRKEVLKYGRFEDGVAIKLTGTFYRLRPKSTKKSITKPITKPDWDNCAKLVSDSLTKFTFRDDAVITTAIIKKRFGEPPRIELLLEEDTDE